MYRILIQRIKIAKNEFVPPTKQLRSWAKSLLEKKINAAEITIRIVSPEEMKILNSTYRHKNKPTNVLSFPLSLPDGIEIEAPPIGDIVICAEVVNQEAVEQNKSPSSHWAHMIVHGLLHLLGFDHETADEAEKMESLEISILETFGISNPYDWRT